MADDPTELVTIRATDGTERTKEVARGALPFFSDWEQLDSLGRKKSHQSTPAGSKES